MGCRQEQSKRALVRVVRAADTHVQVDPTGKAAGRGAYLCSEPECWTVALHRGALGRALRIALSAEDRATLERYRDETLAGPADRAD